MVPEWDTILSLCRAKLRKEDFDIVCQFGSVDELVEYSISLQKKFKETKSEYEWSRLGNFFRHLRRFHGGLDVLSHVNPASVAPLWGSLRLCIEVFFKCLTSIKQRGLTLIQLVYEANGVFEMIVNMYDDINTTLPQVAEYTKILHNPEAVVEPCREGRSTFLTHHNYYSIADKSQSIFWSRNSRAWLSISSELIRSVSTYRPTMYGA